MYTRYTLFIGSWDSSTAPVGRPLSVRKKIAPKHTKPKVTSTISMRYFSRARNAFFPGPKTFPMIPLDVGGILTNLPDVLSKKSDGQNKSHLSLFKSSLYCSMLNFELFSLKKKDCTSRVSATQKTTMIPRVSGLQAES